MTPGALLLRFFVQRTLYGSEFAGSAAETSLIPFTDPLSFETERLRLSRLSWLSAAFVSSSSCMWLWSRVISVDMRRASRVDSYLYFGVKVARMQEGLCGLTLSLHAGFKGRILLNKTFVFTISSVDDHFVAADLHDVASALDVLARVRRLRHRDLVPIGVQLLLQHLLALELRQLRHQRLQLLVLLLCAAHVALPHSILGLLVLLPREAAYTQR